MTIHKDHNCLITSYPEYLEVAITEENFSGEPVEGETDGTSNNSTANNTTDDATNHNTTDNTTNNTTSNNG